MSLLIETERVVTSRALRQPRRLVSFIILVAFIAMARPESRAGAQPAILPPIEVGDLTVRLEHVASGFSGPAYPDGPIQYAPTVLVHANDGSGRLFIATIGGVVRIIVGGELLDDPFLELSHEENAVDPANYGLTGLAFHPGFADRESPGWGRLFTVSAELSGSGVPDFTAPQRGDDHRSVIYEWRIDPENPNSFDPSTRRELLRIQQPMRNHNVNEVAFGPDGYLYIGVGDGGNNPSLSMNAQQISNVFGSTLRIDVDCDKQNMPSANGQYAIPSDNPFVGVPNAVVEIYAYGFRNPWRLSFDRDTGELYAGDVGQSSVEEINLVTKGGNYGWNHKEGSMVYDNVDFTNFSFQNTNTVVPDVPDKNGQTLADLLGLTDPIAEYDHLEGRCVIGGYVYRGRSGSDLAGVYVFAEYTFGRFLYIDPANASVRSFQIDPSGVQFPPGTRAFALGEDENGDVYLLANLHPVGLGYGVLRMVPTGLVGDLNGDSVVNIFDVIVLLNAWGTCDDPGDCPADLNSDGAVNVFDLLTLLNAMS